MTRKAAHNRRKSIHWSRHIAFKEYLTRNLAILMEYQNLKLKLSENQWLNGNDYNAAKNNFIKYHEKIALKEFETNNKRKQQ
jgi:GrpB-like predicted nucleotidyltransferase (UPF0157 family)